MGFITKQWLEGEAVRYRHYKPVKVKISGQEALRTNDSLFGIRNGFVNVAFYIQAAKHPYGYEEKGDYQEIWLTKDEVNKLLPAMVEVGEPSICLEIARSILARLTDEELSQFMKRLLPERSQLKVGP